MLLISFKVNSNPFFLWDWIKAGDILQNLSHCDSSLLGKMSPFLDNFICSFSFWDSFVPNNSCVINCSENVKDLVSRLKKHLFRPAALVPTVNHEVIDGFVDVALVVPHVQELIGKRDFWE